MTTRLVSRLVLAGLLLAAAGGGAFAFANADALSATATALVPSEAPALLGPIDERGRAGWACKPERSAESSNAAMAQLPDDTR